jgi:hypothetical protein
MIPVQKYLLAYLTCKFIEKASEMRQQFGQYPHAT